MGAEGAVNILHRKATDDEKQKAIKEYQDNFSNPYKSSSLAILMKLFYQSKPVLN
jgi:propionyl-CoA carboxylase beta chain